MCLPEFRSKAVLLRRARALGLDPVAGAPLAPRRHALTHLTLAIEPVVAAGRPRERATRIHGAGSRWTGSIRPR